MMKKKGQFLLLSIAVLIIAMYASFQYIYTSSETSSVLFQPSFSEDAFNLFRAINDRNDWIEDGWYNFTMFQARRKIKNPISGDTHLFNVSLNCTDVVVINSTGSKLNAIEIQGIDNCTINVSNVTEGDYIYYFFDRGVNFTEIANLTIGNESSPWYYDSGSLTSKLCSHVSVMYSEKQIQLECTVY